MTTSSTSTTTTEPPIVVKTAFNSDKEPTAVLNEDTKKNVVINSMKPITKAILTEKSTVANIPLTESDRIEWWVGTEKSNSENIMENFQSFKTTQVNLQQDTTSASINAFATRRID